MMMTTCWIVPAPCRAGTRPSAASNAGTDAAVPGLPQPAAAHAAALTITSAAPRAARAKNSREAGMVTLELFVLDSAEVAAHDAALGAVLRSKDIEFDLRRGRQHEVRALGKFVRIDVDLVPCIEAAGLDEHRELIVLERLGVQQRRVDGVVRVMAERVD